MKSQKLRQFAELLEAIHSLRTEWMESGCPTSLEGNSQFRRLCNLQGSVGSEAKEMAELIHSTLDRRRDERPFRKVS